LDSKKPKAGDTVRMKEIDNIRNLHGGHSHKRNRRHRRHQSKHNSKKKKKSSKLALFHAHTSDSYLHAIKRSNTMREIYEHSKSFSKGQDRATSKKRIAKHLLFPYFIPVGIISFFFVLSISLVVLLISTLRRDTIRSIAILEQMNVTITDGCVLGFELTEESELYLD
ncbi:hypothetical protein ADUPG1_002424, partial [Aduncisulcus paluster]